jgi:hypothetical protein
MTDTLSELTGFTDEQDPMGNPSPPENIVIRSESTEALEPVAKRSRVIPNRNQLGPLGRRALNETMNRRAAQQGSDNDYKLVETSQRPCRSKRERDFEEYRRTMEEERRTERIQWEQQLAQKDTEIHRLRLKVENERNKRQCERRRHLEELEEEQRHSQLIMMMAMTQTRMATVMAGAALVMSNNHTRHR